VSVRSARLVPTAITTDARTVLGTSLHDYVVTPPDAIREAVGLAGIGRLSAVGRTTLFPTEGLLAVTRTSADGVHLVFSLYHPAARMSSVAVVRRPPVPGGDPLLVSRVATRLIPGVGGGASADRRVAMAARSRRRADACGADAERGRRVAPPLAQLSTHEWVARPKSSVRQAQQAVDDSTRGDEVRIDTHIYTQLGCVQDETPTRKAPGIQCLPC